MPTSSHKDPRIVPFGESIGWTLFLARHLSLMGFCPDANRSFYATLRTHMRLQNLWEVRGTWEYIGNKVLGILLNRPFKALKADLR